MPTNLPPEAQEAEQRYREATTTAERIERLETFISLIPKHKGTDKLRANLRQRLSKLRSASQGQQGVARHVSPYRLDREGAGQAVLVGPANVGKSALVAALTNADPEVAAFPFSTWGPTPGMMLIDNVQVQLVDLPPLSEDYIEPEMIELIRRSDLVLLVVDIEGLTLQQLEDTAVLLRQHRIVPTGQAEAGSRLNALPFLVVVNKIDDDEAADDFAVLEELVGDEWTLLPISAVTGRGVDAFKRVIFERLKIMRIYSKPPNEDPDRSAPFVLPRGSTVEEFAGKVHRDFLAHLKSARVWGEGVYDGQAVGRDHVLHDGDVVELRA